MHPVMHMSGARKKLPQPVALAVRADSLTQMTMHECNIWVFCMTEIRNV